MYDVSLSLSRVSRVAFSLVVRIETGPSQQGQYLQLTVVDPRQYRVTVRTCFNKKLFAESVRATNAVEYLKRMILYIRVYFVHVLVVVQ